MTVVITQASNSLFRSYYHSNLRILFTAGMSIVRNYCGFPTLFEFANTVKQSYFSTPYTDFLVVLIHKFDIKTKSEFQI